MPNQPEIIIINKKAVSLVTAEYAKLVIPKSIIPKEAKK